MSSRTDEPVLSVSDFTSSVEPLVNFLKTKYAEEPFRISDVWDDPKPPSTFNPPADAASRQYIDLVQEGGGVHGIALTGFTYMLEKMGVSFMKMAGTSAGAINTMLLSCIYTQREAALLDQDTTKYYETRSEKLLEYLAKKKLTDLVDGPPKWQKLLRRLFSGEVNFEPVKKYTQWVLMGVKIFVISIALLFLSSLLFIFTRDESSFLYTGGLWLATIGVILLLISLYFLYKNYRHISGLRRTVREGLGINPGGDFEKWLTTCMIENGIHTVQDLRNKLDKEERVMGYTYKPLILQTSRGSSLFEADTSGAIEAPSVLQEKIADPEISISSIKRSYQKNNDQSRSLFESTNSTPSVEDQRAFARRTENFMKERGIHKEIVIVAADIMNEVKVEFPGMHQMYWGDDMSISPARYVRASMSIPIFFFPLKVAYDDTQSSTIIKEWNKYMNVQKTFKKNNDVAMFVDGGLLSNFPLNVFYNPEMPLPSRPTIGIKLEYEDETVPNDITTEKGLLGSLMSTMRFFYDRDFINKHNMYKKTVRSIDTGKVHWLNFSLSSEEQIELFFRGALAAAIFMGKVKRDSTELTELKKHGKGLKVGDKTFSIFKKDDDFKTEDLLIPNITFDWERYKIDRIKDALSANPDILRENAMMK